MRDVPQTPQGVAERRQLTVLFCDLVNSTALSDSLDPEAYRELVLAYQQAVGEVVGRHRGHVAQYLGDGMLVYFGYPAAQDDDAERAVRAGYDILQALARLSHQPALQARVGVHTGPVVVGQMGGTGKTETLAMGATTNVAARLQGIAQPQAVVISEATHKLVPGMFITRELGTHSIRGIDKPLAVYEVTQPSGVRTRLEAAEHLTPFVGRQQELALLLDRWQQAQEGRGQAVLLSADPGIGKSRLMLMFHEQLGDARHTWLDCRASPMAQGSAWQPIVELLHRGLVLREGDSAAIKLQKLEQALDLIGQDKAEAVPLLAPLLNLELAAPYQPSPNGAELKRRKTMDLLNTWLLALAAHQPLILAFEDLHWSDPSTIESLTRLLEQIPSHPVLLLFTARPEFQPNWPVRPHLAIMPLQPLRSTDTDRMLESLTARRVLPEPVKQRILKQAGGVPLFLEEITKALLESGQLVERDDRLELAGPLEQLEIPATLQDSLMARLDRLGEAKAVAQVCAVIGREIPYRLLGLVADAADAALQRHLEALTDAQLLYPRGSPPEASYLFKHALIQDTAYHSLLKSTRQKLHGLIGQALEAHFPERAKTEPEVLALHFEKALQVGKAVTYYKAAAEDSANKSAMAGAVDCANHALHLLPSLPADSARDVLELTLLNDQIQALYVVCGYGHPRVKQAAQRATALLDDTHEPILQVGLLGALWVTHTLAGEFESALSYARQITALGRRHKVPVFELAGHAWAAGTLTNLGRFAEAQESAALATLPCDLAASRLMATQAGADPVSFALNVSGWALYALGYPDQAHRSTEGALERAEAVGVPSNLCNAASLATVGWLTSRHEGERLLAVSSSTVELCRKYGYVHGEAWAMRSLAQTMCRFGQLEAGLVLLRQGNAASLAVGALADVAAMQLNLAEAHLACGHAEQARDAVEEALRESAQINYGWLLAEMHRMKGEVLLAMNQRPEAEASFHKALEVSRSQQAKSFELRAACSLARLWRKQGRVTEARDLLQPVYDWFTEGFDTPDLMDARALLAELGE